MSKRFRLLTTDIAFAAVLILCAALAMLTLSYNADIELRQRSALYFSMLQRDAAFLDRDTGKLLRDIDRTLESLLDPPSSLRNARQQTDAFRHVLRSAPYLRSISLIDPQGKVLLSSTPENTGRTLDLNACMSSPPTSESLLRICPTYAGRDLANGVPLTDNGKSTPEQGFIPIVHSRLSASGEAASLVATLNLDYLARRSADMLEGYGGARIALLRADGLRLFDSETPDAGLLPIERAIPERWKEGRSGEARPLEAIDGRRWIVADHAHPLLPIGIVFALDHDEIMESARQRLRANSLTAILPTLVGMVCALFGYLFFRYAGRRERERQQQADAQRRLLERTLDACAKAMVITTPAGVIEWVNPAYTTLTGYTAAEAIGRTPREQSKSGMQSDSLYAQMWQTLLKGRIWHGELVNRRKDNSLYDEFLTIAPALDDNGAIRHFIATKEDCSEYKATRRRLAVAHAHLGAVVENFPGALVMEDTQGRIVLLNQFIFELLGLPGTDEYVLGKPVHPLMLFSSHVAEDSQAFLDRVAELRESARPFYNEEIHFKDGRWIERDFIPIPLRDDLIGFLYIYRDISQKKRHARELWQLATSDPLTGLHNRRAFFEQIERERARLVRYPGEAALLVIDIDYFKRINDTYGHSAGDAVLKHIVQLVRKLLRESDVMARLGGEEFAILLPQSGREGALGLAERVRAMLEENPLNYNDTQIHITASVGVTIMTARDSSTDQALSRADHALYAAKRNGRNRVESQ
ncbi:MAG: diguanylate cyclase [Azoarcus sp.]|jgi:diguanylate cyclase (GGDEF)-like protein/PAS domain S-box-containing protein|nr:diguanylate cyclase [Azoarcus sp.]